MDESARLLAVDAGLRAGLALFDGRGKVLWSRSHNYGARSRLRKAILGQLRSIDGLEAVAVEGGGHLADPWLRAAERLELAVLHTQADCWRRELLLPRERDSGKRAKSAADEAARRILAWSGAPRPTSLRHDAAEAVLIGLWACWKLGWIEALPPEIHRGAR